MKKSLLLSLALVVFSALIIPANAQERNKKKPSKEAEEWFRKKAWLNGLDVKPSKSIDVQEFYNQYQANKKYWDEAFAFFKNHDLKTLPVGRYPIDSNYVSASVTDAPTKDFDNTHWESHRKYIDLQYVISGEEKIGVCGISKATVTNPYDEKKDVANYNAEGETYSATPATFFIFFNNDAHRPNITPGGNKPDKKRVFKIRSAE